MTHNALTFTNTFPSTVGSGLALEPVVSHIWWKRTWLQATVSGDEKNRQAGNPIQLEQIASITQKPEPWGNINKSLLMGTQATPSFLPN